VAASPNREQPPAAPEEESPRSDTPEEMDPHAASVLRMGAQTLDEALGFASTRDLLHLYGAVSDAVTDRLMVLAQDARPVPPPGDDPMPFASGAEASGYHTPPSGMEPPAGAASASAGAPVPEPQDPRPMDGGCLNTGPWSTREGWKVSVSLPPHICRLRRPDNWPYPDLFIILHEQELPSWIPRQGVPEALKHLTVRGYCTYPCPKNGHRCIGLCLRPVLLGEDRAHAGHACFFCK
jgi:hypothetical protein